MEYYNELPDGPLGIIRSKTSRVWHTDKKTAVSSSSQRDSGLTAVFCMPNVLVLFGKEMCGVVFPGNLLHTTPGQTQHLRVKGEAKAATAINLRKASCLPRMQ